MKILGKALLYILMYWLLGSFLENYYDGAIYEMVSDANRTMRNLVPSEDGKIIQGFRYWLLWNNGANLISFVVVLIFYLAVDKKVWKS
tara:strand:- start:43 stop:306 length:264 start_codon:yes stop_codon:yes gene_type:complete